MKHKFLTLFALPFLMCSCTLDEILEKLNLMGASEEEIMQYAVENAEKWDDAFENMFFTNYTMDVYFDSHFAISNGEIVELGEHYQHHNHLEVCDTAVLYQIGVESHDYDIYMEKSGSEWLAYRYKDESKMYESITIQELHGSIDLTIEEAKNRMVDEASLYVTFKNDYEKFTFDEENHEYYCEGIIRCDLSDEIYGEMDLAARKVHIKFEKGQLVSMAASYVCYEDESKIQEYFEKVGDAYTFEITNIGRTVVQEPTNIKK